MTETIAERLLRTWQRTDLIFSTLRPEAFLARPIALRHPFIFYVGHLPAFAWIHICGGILGRPSFAPALDDMFSRGIDPDVDDPERCHDHPEVPERWPDLDTVLAYRDRVRGAVLHRSTPWPSGRPPISWQRTDACSPWSSSTSRCIRRRSSTWSSSSPRR